MKFIITKTKLHKAALLWLNKNYSPDQLEVVEYPNSMIYRKNGKVVMEQHKKSKFFWFDYSEIWSFFASFFSMENKEIRGLLKIWLEETFKLEGYTPHVMPGTTKRRLEETFKLKNIYML